MAFKESTTIAHPPADVFTALASEEFNRKVTEGLGGQLVAFERQGEPTGPVSVTMLRSVPVHRLPETVQKFAGKFLGDKLSVEQQENWSAPAADGSRTGQLLLSVTAVKVTATAEQRLVPNETGTDVQVDGYVECRIPLVGGKLAEAAEPRVGKVLARQSREVTDWLDR
ncbi:DUF2505 domain-containing protein [Citricoccus sp.]|uniref:DUF2505 domain-containing protein n=1 Tax=Citricoccus sp. TaxID=1978372 RepID=UPI0026040D35|nr:DUF2505 domain-containing protein [Citricoccus sp.]HRO30465.1 DUF2505 domain-containing protein [Citricoccus sp.]HRO92560.1 DUF2505 domain-containing protein [Citricoccus sp.]